MTEHARTRPTSYRSKGIDAVGVDAVEEMTPGEIGRSLNRLEKSQADQTETLDEIKRQTTKTNGRVDRLEDAARGRDRELARLNSAVFARSAVATVGPVPDATAGPDINLKLSPRMWAILIGLAGSFSVFIPLLVKWAEKLVGLTP